MMVRLTHAAWRVRNLADRHLPVIHGEVGKIVYEDRTRIGASWVLGADGGFGEQSKSCD